MSRNPEYCDSLVNFMITGKKTVSELLELIANGADVNVAAPRGITPLYLACRHQEFVQLILPLIAAGADVDFLSENGIGSLYAACRNPEAVQFVPHLLSRAKTVELSDLKECYNRLSLEGKVDLYEAICGNKELTIKKTQYQSLYGRMPPILELIVEKNFLLKDKDGEVYDFISTVVSASRSQPFGPHTEGYREKGSSDLTDLLKDRRFMRSEDYHLSSGIAGAVVSFLERHNFLWERARERSEERIKEIEKFIPDFIERLNSRSRSVAASSSTHPVASDLFLSHEGRSGAGDGRK